LMNLNYRRIAARPTGLALVGSVRGRYRAR